jgi:fumarate hydratase class II
MIQLRTESDSLGEVEVPADKLWGAQTQRSLEHFSIGDDLMPREMIVAYAALKKAAAEVNHAGGRLGDRQYELIVQTCDEILAGQHQDQFPLHVWMTGSGTQFNMNVNEVISNRCCQIAGTALGAKDPVHPNDHDEIYAPRLFRRSMSKGYIALTPAAGGRSRRQHCRARAVAARPDGFHRSRWP